MHKPNRLASHIGSNIAAKRQQDQTKLLTPPYWYSDSPHVVALKEECMATTMVRFSSVYVVPDQKRPSAVRAPPDWMLERTDTKSAPEVAPARLPNKRTNHADIERLLAVSSYTSDANSPKTKDTHLSTMRMVVRQWLSMNPELAAVHSTMNWHKCQGTIIEKEDNEKLGKLKKKKEKKIVQLGCEFACIRIKCFKTVNQHELHVCWQEAGTRRSNCPEFESSRQSTLHHAFEWEENELFVCKISGMPHFCGIRCTAGIAEKITDHIYTCELTGWLDQGNKRLVNPYWRPEDAHDDDAPDETPEDDFVAEVDETGKIKAAAKTNVIMPYMYEEDKLGYRAGFDSNCRETPTMAYIADTWANGLVKNALDPITIEHELNSVANRLRGKDSRVYHLAVCFAYVWKMFCPQRYLDEEAQTQQLYTSAVENTRKTLNNHRLACVRHEDAPPLFIHDLDVAYASTIASKRFAPQIAQEGLVEFLVAKARTVLRLWYMIHDRILRLGNEKKYVGCVPVRTNITQRHLGIRMFVEPAMYVLANGVARCQTADYDVDNIIIHPDPNLYIYMPRDHSTDRSHSWTKYTQTRKSITNILLDAVNSGMSVESLNFTTVDIGALDTDVFASTKRR